MDGPLTAPAQAGGATVTLRVERIAAGGDGVTHEPGGRVVFVPRAAPGDLVEVKIVRERARWAAGRIVRVIEAGPERLDPPCPYYVRCGGCHLQHLTYAAQLAAKAAIVRDALARIGGFREVRDLDVVPSPHELRYRNRVTFTLDRTGEELRAGYHSREDPDELLDVADCLLAEPPVAEAWTRLRAVWGPQASRLPPGPRLRLTLRATEDGEVGLVVEGGDAPGRPARDRGAWPEIEALREAAGLDAVWWLDDHGRERARAGPGALTEQWGGSSVPLAADAFLQVNRPVAAALDAHALEACGPIAGRRVVDAYAGVGLRALELARRGARVVGIESNPRSVMAAESLAREEGLPLRFRRARVEHALAWELPADVVVLNPPREGVAREVTKALLARPPARIVYVSCDPATLARDLRRLGPATSLAGVRAFDMFPQTAHVETVVRLERARA